MSFWLHVLVIYPLAAWGGLVLVGILYPMSHPYEHSTPEEWESRL